MRDKVAGPGRKLRHNWLLIKERDEVARTGAADLLLRETTSAKTGRSMEEIAAGKPARKKKAAPATQRIRRASR